MSKAVLANDPPCAIKGTCQDNSSPRNSPLISSLLPQAGTDFAQTSRTAFLTCWEYIVLKKVHQNT